MPTTATFTFSHQNNYDLDVEQYGQLAACLEVDTATLERLARQDYRDETNEEAYGWLDKIILGLPDLVWVKVDHFSIKA